MPAHHHAPEYHLSAAGPLAERAIAAAPTRSPVYKPPPINSVRDRVTHCLHSFPLPDSETTAPIAISRCTPCVNNRPDSLRHWTGTQFLTPSLP